MGIAGHDCAHFVGEAFAVGETARQLILEDLNAKSAAYRAVARTK
jgi:hypothetical protein